MEPIEINSIQLMLTDESFTLKDRGKVLVARLIGNYTRTQVGEALLGQTVTGRKIKGVEMFLVERQKDCYIGILLE